MRILLYVLAVYQAANGAIMVAAPDFWYAVTPDADRTGPANLHFIRDIGLAFLAAAAALALAVQSTHRAVLVWVAFVFLGGHAALHLLEAVLHGVTMSAAIRDTALIGAPALLPLFALRRSGRRTGSVP
ncbi:MAG: hypothetical protein F4204_02770 [Rhodospirillaceae bacterium]|nr:hypothetical protein [Rhodospirillaceae bacterium]MYG51285.1 hypothetical protein [Rhodospirillaceae bacterium]